MATLACPVNPKADVVDVEGGDLEVGEDLLDLWWRSMPKQFAFDADAALLLLCPATAVSIVPHKTVEAHSRR